MREVQKKFPLNIFELVLTITVFIILSYCTYRFWVEYGLPDKFTNNYALFAVLLFNVLWIIAMILWPLKNIRIKILITLPIFIFSSAFVTYVIVWRLLCHVM